MIGGIFPAVFPGAAVGEVRRGPKSGELRNAERRAMHCPGEFWRGTRDGG
jgi:hypothetical protein